MKIAFGGPSGSGKTTLATFIAELSGVRQIQSWETRKFPEAQIKIWETMFNYSGNAGHRKLIQLQAQHPTFGLSWQKACLESRGDLIAKDNNFVMDRSPLDNVVYFLLQTSSAQSPEEVAQFIHRAQMIYAQLTHFVIIKVEEQDEVEDNESRVANIFYQRMVSAVFQDVFDLYFAHISGPKVLRLNTWDLAERKDLVASFIGYTKDAI